MKCGSKGMIQWHLEGTQHSPLQQKRTLKSTSGSFGDSTTAPEKGLGWADLSGLRGARSPASGGESEQISLLWETRFPSSAFPPPLRVPTTLLCSLPGSQQLFRRLPTWQLVGCLPASCLPALGFSSYRDSRRLPAGALSSAGSVCCFLSCALIMSGPKQCQAGGWRARACPGPPQVISWQPPGCAAPSLSPSRPIQ